MTADVLGDAAPWSWPRWPARCGERASPPRTSAADVAERWAIWRAEKARRVGRRPRRGVSRRRPCSPPCRGTCPQDAVVTVDVGNHAYSFGRYFESKGQPVLMSGYLGSIGFGYPAAMGAWAADPTRPVVAVTGDGGFGQYAMELTTAVKYGIPVKHVLLNNNALGKISKEQLAADYPVWQTSLTNPDLAAYAELCGARGITVTPPRRARRRDDRALRHRRTRPALRRAGRRAALNDRTPTRQEIRCPTRSTSPASRPPSSTAPSSAAPR